MADTTRQTCSLCGSVFSGTTDVVPVVCPTCQQLFSRRSPDTERGAGPSNRTAPIASEKTRIMHSSDTEHDVNQPATVDFVASSAPTDPAPERPAAPPMNQKHIGRFQVTDVLGCGSFGTVYRARDPLLDRDVALKVPRFLADDGNMLERFHREAKAAARLRHPNIVTLYETGETELGPFLVVEFVDGVPLAYLVRRPIDLRTAADWVRQIAEALHYAHGEGIIHRDVKPANILINTSERPQITDFGLAKRDADIASGMTVEGQILGTPNYMSPEQARGSVAEVGPHSDQYSVGVVLYELMCGQPPFVGDPWTVVARVANVREAPPAPRSVRPDLPRDLEACCLKAMEKDPRARYSDLKAMADDLDRWLKGLPLVARPIGRLEQLMRWCRHNRLIATLYGTVAVLLVTAAIAGPWLAIRFRELAADAQREAHDAQNARNLEKESRLATERSIIDSYTETGLIADRNGDPREAILWFANAAAAAENYPSRERHNRIRVESWLSRVTVPILAFAGTPTWKKALSYDPSGRWLLCLSNDGLCELLQVSDGKRFAISLSGPVNAAEFSPDGSLMAAAAGHEVVVFEMPQLAADSAMSPSFPGKEFDRWMHTDAALCLRFSGDGQSLVLGGDHSLQVRNVHGKSYRQEPFQVASPVNALAISADGRRFAVKCEDQQVCVFAADANLSNREPLLQNLPANSEGILPPMFLGQGQVVVIDKTHGVRCWNTESKAVVWEHKPPVRVLAATISPDERWVALGEDGELVLLDRETGKPLERRMKHPNLINNISFSPDSRLVLTACVDHAARVFEVSSGQMVGPPIQHCDAVHRCVWSPDGATFATVHWSGDLIRIWRRCATRDEEFVAAPSARTPFVRLHAQGTQWISCGLDAARDLTEIEVCDIHTGQPLGPKLSAPGLISDADFIFAARGASATAMPEHPAEQAHGVVRPEQQPIHDGTAGPPSARPRVEQVVVLVGGGLHDDLRLPLLQQNLDGAGFVRFVSTETGKSVFPDITTVSQPIAVRSSPDGRTVAILCHRGHLLLVSAANGKTIAEQQAFDGRAAVHGYVIRDRIRFSPQGDRFLVWGCDAEAELRDSHSGALLARMQHDNGFVHDAGFSPDGKLVATCSSDAFVRLWDASTGAKNGAPLPHSGWIFNAQFSSDGRKLLTACEDKQARIWDLATRSVIVATREHGDQVFGVTFLPGEEFFLASTRNGQVTAWDSTLGKMIAPMRVMPGMVYQLTRSRAAPRVIASGQLKPARGFDWNQWIREPAEQLKREEIRLWGELISSQRLHEGGAVMSLTSVEWIERWTRFHAKHPKYPPLQIPRPSEKAE